MNKVFVLDTSVVLYDATALSNFDEHDVVMPVTVLEELDQFKKGDGVINLQARVFMRELDRLSEAIDIRHWTPIDGEGKGRFQIDTLYLDSHSNGLSYLIDRLKDNAIYAHVNLE